MPRFIKQRDHSYQYKRTYLYRASCPLEELAKLSWSIGRFAIGGFEIAEHVSHAFRPDADPVFNEVAHEAAMNGLHHRFIGRQGVCFLQPTSHPRGYYSLLKFIASREGSCRQIDILEAWNWKYPRSALIRLTCSRLVSIVERMTESGTMGIFYEATDLGKAYLEAAKPYIVKRSAKSS